MDEQEGKKDFSGEEIELGLEDITHLDGTNHSQPQKEKFWKKWFPPRKENSGEDSTRKDVNSSRPVSLDSRKEDLIVGKEKPVMKWWPFSDTSEQDGGDKHDKGGDENSPKSEGEHIQTKKSNPNDEGKIEDQKGIASDNEKDSSIGMSHDIKNASSKDETVSSSPRNSPPPQENDTTNKIRKFMLPIALIVGIIVLIISIAVPVTKRQAENKLLTNQESQADTTQTGETNVASEEKSKSTEKPRTDVDEIELDIDDVDINDVDFEDMELHDFDFQDLDFQQGEIEIDVPEADVQEDVDIKEVDTQEVDSFQEVDIEEVGDLQEVDDIQTVDDFQEIDVQEVDIQEENVQDVDSTFDRETDIYEALRSVSGSSIEQSTSVQSKAARWLVIDDPMQLTLSGDGMVDVAKLTQRYAITVLYYSLAGRDWGEYTGKELHLGSSRWLSSEDECLWEGVACDSVTSEITEIILKQRNLEGKLPEEISTLSSLQKLDLYGNGVTGELPTSIGMLGQLVYLDLSSNRLSGSLPDSTYDLTALDHLFLENNQFNGTLSSKIKSFKLLVDLRLQGNSFRGEIPASINGMEKLKIMMIQSNSFSGVVPASIGTLDNLWYFDASENYLSGIPQQFFDTVSLERVYLNNNNLGGDISPEFSKLINLEMLWLNDNNFIGEIPSEFGALAALTSLRLQGNSLSSYIPGDVCDLREVNLGELKTVCDEDGECRCCTDCFVQ